MDQPTRADVIVTYEGDGIDFGSVAIHTNPREEVWISVTEVQEEAQRLAGGHRIERIEVDIPVPGTDE